MKTKLKQQIRQAWCPCVVGAILVYSIYVLLLSRSVISETLYWFLDNDPVPARCTLVLSPGFILILTAILVIIGGGLLFQEIVHSRNATQITQPWRYMLPGFLILVTMVTITYYHLAVETFFAFDSFGHAIPDLGLRWVDYSYDYLWPF